MGQTTAHLRHVHHQDAGALQHGLDRVTAVIGWPGFVALLVLAMAVWIAGNLAAGALGLAAIDPPPFFWLQLVASAGALVAACLILTTQRREDRLADHRGQLLLELAIANDQKIAKIIELIEESRRDNPAISNRVDAEAATMATPSNPAEVLEVIRELNDQGALMGG